MLEKDKAAPLIQQALTDPQVQQLLQVPEFQTSSIDLKGAVVRSGPQDVFVSLPLGPQATLHYLQTPRESSAKVVLPQGRRSLHVLPDGSRGTFLNLNKEQTLDVMRQIGADGEFAQVVIDEKGREASIIVKRKQESARLIVTDAQSWSELGPTVIGLTKRGPVRLGSCGSQTVVSGNHTGALRTRPVPLTERGPDQFTACVGGGGDCWDPEGLIVWVFCFIHCPSPDAPCEVVCL